MADQCFADCCYAECHYAECQLFIYYYAECIYAECHYAECRGAMCECDIILNDVVAIRH
jgi:hypothetical protein